MLQCSPFHMPLQDRLFGQCDVACCDHIFYFKCNDLNLSLFVLLFHDFSSIIQSNRPLLPDDNHTSH